MFRRLLARLRALHEASREALREKKRLYRVIFESDTKAGKRFDVALLWCIVVSVVVTVLDSTPGLPEWLRHTFYVIEFLFTLVFSVEYLVRVKISPRPRDYVLSFWGLIDIASILPTYLSLFVSGFHYLLIVRIFRLLRVFRILRLPRFSNEALHLTKSLKASIYKICIFLFAVLVIIVLFGTVMYVIEGEENGFTSIPEGMYWAVITVTTIGYGDIVPKTVLGKSVAALAMVIGYAIIAVPTGIVTAEMTKRRDDAPRCPRCNRRAADGDNYCSNCGCRMPAAGRSRGKKARPAAGAADPAPATPDTPAADAQA